MTRLFTALVVGLSAACGLHPVAAGAQSDARPDCDSLVHWAPQEAQWWDAFQRATADWEVSAALKSTWALAVCASAWDLDRISERMAEAEALEGSALADTLAALRAAQYAVRERRDFAFYASVPADWWAELNAVLNPPKPAVLHFGVHDRMKCAVCVPDQAE